MLTSLLHLPSYSTCSHGFPWCSMKSIGSVSLCHKAASILITDSLKNGPSPSFLYQTIQGQNIPSNEPNPKSGRIIPPSIKIRGSFLCLLNEAFSPASLSRLRSRPSKASCTPARQNAVRVHWHTCSCNAHTVTHQTQHNISFKKTFKVLKRWETIRAVEQVNPTAQNTSRLHCCFVLFIAFGDLAHGKPSQDPWCLC
jgi:hypothetical protein